MARKPFVAAFVGAAAFVAFAFASDIAPCPSDYREQATDYVTSRLENPNGARVQIVSQPYKVRADIGEHSGILGWAVDIRVKARQATGAPGVYLPYSVVFIDGAPVALCEDTDEFTRV